MKLKTCCFTLRYASTRIVQQSNNWYMNAEFTVNQLSFATTLFCDEPEINWFVNQALSTHVFHYNYYGKYGSTARNIRKRRGFCDPRENFSYANYRKWFTVFCIKHWTAFLYKINIIVILLIVRRLQGKSKRFNSAFSPASGFFEYLDMNNFFRLLDKLGEEVYDSLNFLQLTSFFFLILPRQDHE